MIDLFCILLVSNKNGFEQQKNLKEILSYLKNEIENYAILRTRYFYRENTEQRKIQG